MDTKTFNTRIISKHDTKENWALATTFIPKLGEIIVYDNASVADDGTYIPRLKVGDGVHTVEDLKFIYSDTSNVSLSLTSDGLLHIESKEF